MEAMCSKRYWINIRVPKQIVELIEVAASAMGLSKSEFTRYAIIEKLERLSLVDSEAKAALIGETKKRLRRGRTQKAEKQVSLGTAG